MTRVAIPNYSAKPRSKVLWIAPAAVFLAALLAWALPKIVARKSGMQPSSTPMFVVQPMNLDIHVIKDGELQAVNNIDISCQVEGQTTIVQLVKEGTSVKKGDVLAILDSSQIKQKMEDTSLDLQKATAELTAAEEMKDIQQSQNAANLEAAQVALVLAKLALQQYVEGSYPQQLKNAKTDLEMAKTTLTNKLEEQAQIQRLASKGFVNISEIKKAELEVINAQNALDKAEVALTVLSKYTNEMELTSKKNDLVQAERRLVRTQRENASNLAQKEADVSAKDQALQLLNRRYERYRDQVAHCTIKAPAEGLVVYASSGDRNADRPIQEGGAVRERQLLFRLPDTASMKAIIRVQESQVGKLKEGMRAIVRLPMGLNPVQATITKISVLADNAQRWWNPDLKEYPVELALDETPSSLKPGMNAVCDVFVDRLNDVVAVPLTTVYAAGKDAFVFTPSADDNYKPIKVTLGQNNETHIEVKEGLTAGLSVVMLQSGQGRELLENAGIKPTPVAAEAPDAKGPQRPVPPQPSADAEKPAAPGALGAAPGNAPGPGANAGAAAPSNGSSDGQPRQRTGRRRSSSSSDAPPPEVR